MIIMICYFYNLKYGLPTLECYSLFALHCKCYDLLVE